MSKRSTATVREQPVAASTSASGPLEIQSDIIVIETTERIQVMDLTTQIMSHVHRARIREGTVNLFSMHTTCTVLINEFQTALLADIKQFLEHVVARDGEWMHNDPEHSDCDRANADSHLRAMLLGHSLTLQVSGGEIVLGQWQRILLAELDGPRPRSLRIMTMGVA